MKKPDKGRKTKQLNIDDVLNKSDVAASKPKSKKNAKKETKGITVNPDITSAESRQEFFIPISGFIWLYPEEIEIVNHPMFQRLGNIYQLGQTYLVYRGATHKRIEHVLGTLHMAHRMIAAIKYTYKKSRRRQISTCAPITRTEERFTRLGALLHDIGHIAAGHTLEDELCLIGKHDYDDRLDLIFENKDDIWLDKYNRSLKEVIDNEYLSYVPDSLKRKKIIPSNIARLLIRKIPNKKDDRFLSEQEVLEKCDELRLSVCKDLIGNTICADLLDYLYRDWYHIGKVKTFDERILQYLEIKPEKPNFSAVDPNPNHTDRLVISLGESPKIRTDAVSAILDLLESRYNLAETVLFHRTKITASAMLDRALYELLGDKPENIEDYILPFSDEQLITECRKKAEASSNTLSAKILRSLEMRFLYRSLCTFSYDDLKDTDRDQIQTMYGNSYDGTKMAARNRTEALRHLERDFQLPPGSLAMHCPSEQMNAKIAQVRIAVDNRIEKFCDHESNRNNSLSGGHLAAQIKRFHRLWKVQFFIDRQVYEEAKPMLPTLRDAIYKLVLVCLHNEENIDTTCYNLSLSLVSNPDSPWYGKESIKEPASVAYRSETAVSEKYPCGAACLRNFIQEQ